jgi:hypothetical protein
MKIALALALALALSLPALSAKEVTEAVHKANKNNNDFKALHKKTLLRRLFTTSSTEFSDNHICDCGLSSTCDGTVASFTVPAGATIGECAACGCEFMPMPNPFLEMIGRC